MCPNKWCYIYLLYKGVQGRRRRRKKIFLSLWKPEGCKVIRSAETELHSCESSKLFQSTFRYKYWSCCCIKTVDFNAFLDQKGCTAGKHCWVQKQVQTFIHSSGPLCANATFRFRIHFIVLTQTRTDLQRNLVYGIYLAYWLLFFHYKWMCFRSSILNLLVFFLYYWDEKRT